MIIFKVTFVSDFFEDNHLLVFTNEFHWLKKYIYQVFDCIYE